MPKFRIMPIKDSLVSRNLPANYYQENVKRTRGLRAVYFNYKGERVFLSPFVYPYVGKEPRGEKLSPGRIQAVKSLFRMTQWPYLYVHICHHPQCWSERRVFQYEDVFSTSIEYLAIRWGEYKASQRVGKQVRHIILSMPNGIGSGYWLRGFETEARIEELKQVIKERRVPLEIDQLKTTHHGYKCKVLTPEVMEKVISLSWRTSREGQRRNWIDFVNDVVNTPSVGWGWYDTDSFLWRYLSSIGRD